MYLGLGKGEKMAKKKAIDKSKPIDENELSLESQEKIYRLYGVNTAMHMLRPGAKWEISNNSFSRWEDDRPCPTWKDVEWRLIIYFLHQWVGTIMKKVLQKSKKNI